jgi:hypothetical protein
LLLPLRFERMSSLLAAVLAALVVAAQSSACATMSAEVLACLRANANETSAWHGDHLDGAPPSPCCPLTSA